jgi:gluconate 5-dehydrogenase
VSPLKTLFDLTGKTALVTGGSRGLGLQIAEALGEFGARLVLVSRKAADLQQAVAHLTATGCTVSAHAADLGSADAAEAVTDAALRAYGSIDILVNNAGATWGAPAEEHPLDAWNKVMNLNVTGVFLLTQAVGRRCIIPQKAGRIINIASIEGLQGHPPSMGGALAYCTSKGGIVNFTRALAAEWGRYGITVNAIAPGYFPSRMTRAVLEKHEADVLRSTPRGKLGGPDDLKGAALLFASDAGAHITGQTLVVDGGASVI